MDEVFYIVWKPGSTPSVRHRDYATAMDEAKRLAANQPGQEFIVLESRGVAKSHNVIYQEYGPGF